MTTIPTTMMMMMTMMTHTSMHKRLNKKGCFIKTAENINRETGLLKEN